MYTYLRGMPVRDLLTTQAPAFVAAFVIAEAFYKFHSFTLECLAFLATWFLLDAGITGLRRAFSERGDGQSGGGGR